MEIQRIGLVISYQYLSGSPNDPGQELEYGTIEYDFKDAFKDFTYKYFDGEQILIFATYYHASNDRTVSGGDDLYLSIQYGDGDSEIIGHDDKEHNFAGYLGEATDAVATTSFIIGFAPAKKFDRDGKVWTDDIISQTYKGGLHATVINAGYNNEDSYGGTQVGSGAGVYWDGKIEWY